MATQGAIAPNFHEGTRSEYLAQYFFSAFGTSVPVPLPEDSGIDLHCTLGRRAGQRLIVEDYYLVQVKSDVADLTFDGSDAVNWLLSQRHPFFLCVVTKVPFRIQVFQTAVVVLCSGTPTPSRIILHPGGSDDPMTTSFNPEESVVTLSLRRPIIDIASECFSDSATFHNAADVLRAWIRLDQANIDMKVAGGVFFRFPGKDFETNKVPPALTSFRGNFKGATAKDFAGSERWFASTAAHFGALASAAAADGDKERLELLHRLGNDFINSYATLVPTDWVMFWATCINTALKRLGMNGRIIVQLDDGSQRTPEASIVGD